MNDLDVGRFNSCWRVELDAKNEERVRDRIFVHNPRFCHGTLHRRRDDGDVQRADRRMGSTQSILTNPQHLYTKLLLSAVPEPDLPFGELVKNEPNYSIDADRIREQSSEIQHEVKQVADNQFVKQWSNVA